MVFFFFVHHLQQNYNMKYLKHSWQLTAREIKLFRTFGKTNQRMNLSWILNSKDWNLRWKMFTKKLSLTGEWLYDKETALPLNTYVPRDDLKNIARAFFWKIIKNPNLKEALLSSSTITTCLILLLHLALILLLLYL